MKIHFAIALSLVVAMLESPAHARPSDAAQVRKTFARFIAALAARDADAGLSLLSTASLTEWQRDRELALHGTRDEVAGYALSPTIEIVWLEDGDHGFRPRKAVSGFTYAQHLESMADAVAGWISTSSITGR